MVDTKFFKRAGPFTVRELARIANASISNTKDESQLVYDVAPLSEATKQEISFLDNRIYTSTFSTSLAGACIIRPDAEEHAPKGMVLLVTDQPYHGYAKIAATFYPNKPSTPEIHESAFISDEAVLGDGVSIGPNATVLNRSVIGDRTIIGANTTIYEGVEVGSNCHIHSNVTLQCCVIGNKVILHPGVKVGQDGFGFAMSPNGHVKVPQLGRVLVGDDVEIGANTTIDRGTGTDTVIGQGSKIDNLVQIGHNVRLGSGCIIVAQVGISGSADLGNFVAVGGQGGIAGHLKIGDGTQIAAQSGVMKNTDPGSKVGGSPAQPMNEWLRSITTLQRLTKRKG